MSFSVSIQDSQVEYGGRGLKAIFANKLNIFNLKFLKMIKEIIDFYKSAPLLIKDNLEQITLGNYLKKKNMSDYFIELPYNTNGCSNMVNATFKS